jgi:hypothetical protein
VSTINGYLLANRTHLDHRLTIINWAYFSTESFVLSTSYQNFFSF